MTKEQIAISSRNKRVAWKHFYPEGKGKPKKGYVLHHVDTTLKDNNIERYIQWNVEDLVMMTKGEHNHLHHKGKFVSEETRQKMSISNGGANSPNFGKHLPEEQRQKISKSLKGRHLSEETRKKMSESKKGRHFTEEHKAKMSAAIKALWNAKRLQVTIEF